MLTYPRIDPIAFSVGSIDVHWYGLMYLLGFAIAWGLGYYRAQKPNSGWTTEQLGDVIFYAAIGGIAGGRLGYMLFYGYMDWMGDPLSIFRIWEGGMSFHGGIIGFSIALWLYARQTLRPFLSVTDFAAPLAPLGIGLGRIGNFINGELWGRTTDVPWAMVFPYSEGLPRHPSQLYEAVLEGLVLFIIVWWFSAKPRPHGAVSGLFLIGYTVLRSFAELYREPDAHIGYIVLNGLTMGQLLCIPMFILGLYLLQRAYRK